MNYPDLSVGDKFRWVDDGCICRVVAIKDHGIQVEFIYETGESSGQWGYTLLPQKIEKV